MNAFRILFLVVVLAGALVLAMAHEVPSVVEAQSRASLAERARAESVLIQQMELTAQAERARAADRIVADSALRSGMSDPTAPALRSAFRQAASSSWSDASLSLDAVVLVDANGAVIDSMTSVNTIDASDFAEKGRVGLAMARSEGVVTYFGILGRLFAAHAAPVADPAGRVVGAVVAVQEYDAAAVASRRSGTGANSAFFLGFDVIASNIGEVDVSEAVSGVVRRTTASSIGEPGRLLLQEYRQSGDRTVMIAPVRLANRDTQVNEGAAEVGFVVTVDAPTVPGNLPALLTRMRAFDEGAETIWIAVGVGLLVFFGGLAFLDNAIGRSTNGLAKRIRDNATENDPAPVEPSDYVGWLRPVAESFNVFLDAYRAQTPSSRKARQDSSAALFSVDPSQGDRPVFMHSGPSASISGELPLQPSQSAAASTAVFDDTAESTTDHSPGLFRIDTGRHLGVTDEEAPEPVEPTSSEVVDPFADFAGLNADGTFGAEPSTAPDVEPTVEASEAESAPDAEVAPEAELADDAEVAPEALFVAPAPVDAQPADDSVGASDEAAELGEDVLELADEDTPDGDDLAALFAEAEEVVERAESGGAPRLPQITGNPVDVCATEVAEETLNEFDAEWSALMSDVEASISGNRAAVVSEEDRPTAAGDAVSERLAAAEASVDDASPVDAGKPTHGTMMMPGLGAFGADDAPSPAEVAEAPPSVGTVSMPGLGAFAADALDAPEPTSDDDWEVPDRSGASAPVGGEAPATDADPAPTEPKEPKEPKEPTPAEPSPAVEPQPAAAAPSPASAAHTMVGMQFGAGGPVSAFQRLRAGSTPPDVDAVVEPSLGGQPEAEVAAAVEPVQPPPVPASELGEAEGTVDDDEKSPADMQQGDTVPRVSLEELERRAASAGSGGEQDALLAAAEDRLRRLRPGATEEPKLPEEHRELYEQFRSAKELVGEDVSRLTYARFVAKLDRNRSALMSRYECRDVRFDVSIRGGKVTLKATPIR